MKPGDILSIHWGEPYEHCSHVGLFRVVKPFDAEAAIVPYNTHMTNAADVWATIGPLIESGAIEAIDYLEWDFSEHEERPAIEPARFTK